MRRLAVVVTIVFAPPGLSGACRARQDGQAAMDMAATDSIEQHATAAAQEAMSGPMPADPHMTLTPLLPGSRADSARAAALVAAMRAALDKYRDVQVAQADGFRQFLPGVPQPIYHFTNRRWALEEMLRFDAAKPTSLLYRKQSDGAFVLVGAMYAAPGHTSLDQLDARVPLSVARWHEHVNWCVPPLGRRDRWRETREGRPVFGPKSPIATAAACAAVGGRFLPHIFGWMVHVMAFSRDDPHVIWGAGHELRSSR
jgi:hypothetical protein